MKPRPGFPEPMPTRASGASQLLGGYDADPMPRDPAGASAFTESLREPKPDTPRRAVGPWHDPDVAPRLCPPQQRRVELTDQTDRGLVQKPSSRPDCREQPLRERA